MTMKIYNIYKIYKIYKRLNLVNTKLKKVRIIIKDCLNKHHNFNDVVLGSPEIKIIYLF